MRRALVDGGVEASRLVQSIMKTFMVQMNTDLNKRDNAPTKFLVEAENVDLREGYAVFLIGGLVSGLCQSPVSVLLQPESDSGE